MTENQQLWKNILQYGGTGMSTVGSVLAATGYGTIPGLILMGAGAGMTAGSTQIKDKIAPIPEDITSTVMMAGGGVLGYDQNKKPSLGVSLSSKFFSFENSPEYVKWKMENSAIQPMHKDFYPGAESKYISEGENANIENPTYVPDYINSKMVPTYPKVKQWGINDWLRGIDIPNLSNTDNYYSRISKEVQESLGDKSKNITPSAPGGKATNPTKPTGYAAMLEEANKATTISAIMQGIMGGVSLVNELNADKSTDAMAPVINDVTLDKDQSSFLNAMDMSMSLSNATQTRMAKDMGIDPGTLATSMYAMGNLQKMQVLSQADKTRNEIAMQQENINNQRKQLAVQGKLQTDQFNINKQVEENKDSSKNISAAIAAIISAYPMKTQADFSNQLAVERLARGLS